ncbi:MAG: ParB N-terminal domain-containing protein [Verrucomicrobiaceae bacterium]|nr:ParB N-terminal domain-containing protein [Verrucomicrobiaceae bacterium]
MATEGGFGASAAKVVAVTRQASVTNQWFMGEMKSNSFGGGKRQGCRQSERLGFTRRMHVITLREMSKIATPDGTAQSKLFHNERINVYPTMLSLDQIRYWPENNRTIFTFERLCTAKQNDLSKISLEEVTRFVAEQDIHKLQVLADSIGRNGVQVPLIIRDDGKLLDGNRRFFACQWLKMQSLEKGRKIPETLAQIPVHVIRQSDLSPAQELKILAEANFIPDLKVAWPLDAQARAVDEYFQGIRRSKGLDEEAALEEVVAVFGISRQRASDLLDTLKLTKQFIDAGGSTEEKVRRREIVEEKFVYLWEFRNKAMKGSGAMESSTELAEVRDMFFKLMAKGKDSPITNVKQVEPLIQARKDATAWNMLRDSKGAKLRVVVAMVNDKKEVRKAEDKIRVFLSWLRDADDLSPKAKELLKDVVALASYKSLK